MSEAADEASASIRAADWFQRPETRRLFALFEGDQGRTRVVGGIVRDTILGIARDTSDIDVATELLPEEVTRRAEADGHNVYPTGVEHGTVTVKIGAQTFEVTTLREDIETDGRHAIVRFGTDWKRDAERRDFTMNALFAAADGAIFDPVGGLDDCLARRVRFIGDPAQRIREDRLRVLRFFRFSASHGEQQFDSEGLSACQDAASDLAGLSAERVGAEMKRMLALPAIAQTLSIMTDCGIVPVPALALRMLKTYERSAGLTSLWARLALILVHVEPQRLQHMWRLSNQEVTHASSVVEGARLMAHLKIHEAIYRYSDLIEDVIEVAAVLQGWSMAGREAARAQVSEIEPVPFPISGGDLIARGFDPGRALGAELDRLERKWIDSAFQLDRQALLGDLRLP